MKVFQKKMIKECVNLAFMTDEELSKEAKKSNEELNKLKETLKKVLDN